MRQFQGVPRLVTLFLRVETSCVAYNRARGKDHSHLPADRLHCRTGVASQDVTKAMLVFEKASTVNVEYVVLQKPVTERQPW